MPRIGHTDLQHMDGVPPQMDDVDKQAVSVYGSGVAVGDTAIAAFTATTDANAGLATLYTSPHPRLFNETTWDRQRNNHDLILLASAVRGATTNSANQLNYNARGVILYWDVTVVPGADTVTLTICAWDAVGSNWEILLTGGAEVGVGAFCYMVYPGAGAAANDVDVVAAYPLPRIWRARLTHSGVGNFTYSLGASYIN